MLILYPDTDAQRCPSCASMSFCITRNVCGVCRFSPPVVRDPPARDPKGRCPECRRAGTHGPACSVTRKALSN